MRLPLSFVLPLLVGAGQAASESAKVYIFQKPEFQTTSAIQTLTPEEAKLVIAQRLGTSQRHILSGASRDALAHINTFGGPQKQLLPSDNQDVRSQLLIVIDNASPEAATRYQNAWASTKPAFEISSPPWRTATEQLISKSIKEEPLMEINRPCRVTRGDSQSSSRCWPEKSKIVQFQAASGESFSSQILKIIEALGYVENEAMDVMVILMPESRHHYDLYEMPARIHGARSIQFEEPIEETETSPIYESNIFGEAEVQKNVTKPVTYSTCYSRNDTCQNATNNCFGHGHCNVRYKSDTPDDSCYACECIPSINITLAADGKTLLARRTYWGGAACQKEDVSSPFWLLVGVTVVLVGIVSVGIGMLFSIGEEKLPSVIGAGVSGPKAR